MFIIVMGIIIFIVVVGFFIVFIIVVGFFIVFMIGFFVDIVVHHCYRYCTFYKLNINIIIVAIIESCNTI